MHRFSLGAVGATFTARSGETLQFAWPEVLAVLRGVRAARTDVTRPERSKSFSLARAVLTGGMVLSRTSTKTVHSSSETTEQVILLYLRDGRAAATLAEHELEFSCLGPGMEPSSARNLTELARRLREHAKGAYYDERLLRLGRRPLPFLMGGVESRSDAGGVVVVRSDTGDSLDVLAEVMRQAVAEGFLP
ncbi:MAG TPA: hypothetical protein VFG59_16615 [Anaeromyxobacter sp.]|nr:hypothetical protein [Anaeromyxobacter sp.]